MMRARRLVPAALAATLAMAGLSACSIPDPQVAVYFGDTVHLTNDRVQRLIDDAREKAERFNAEMAAQRSAYNKAQGVDQTVAPAPVKLTFTANDVVKFVLQDDVLTDLAKRKGITTKPVPDAGLSNLAGALGTSPDAEITQIVARGESAAAQLRQTAKPAGPPTDADLRQVYDALVAHGAPAGQFDKFKRGLGPEDLQVISGSDALRDDVRNLTRELRVKVNPKYGPMRFDVTRIQGNGSGITIVDAPFEGVDLSVPVTDVTP